jgi:hypothetical protein
MPRLTPALARSRARLGALAVHARHDPRVTTAPGRAAFLARFEREVDAADPDGKLDPVERARRVVYLRRLYFARLAYRSQIARAENTVARRRAKRPWLAAQEREAAKEAGDGR